MLEYNKNINTINQFVIINEDGNIIENETAIFKKHIGNPISKVHPFFENLNSLLTIKDQEFSFKCVNLDFEDKKYITDITIKTFDEDPNSVIIIDDLTAHYNNLHTVVQLRNESLIKAQLLIEKNRLLEEKEAFKNQFITKFSNEIKMPINSINRFCLHLKNTDLSQSQHYNLNFIENTNNYVKHLINNVLDISKIEAGHFNEQISRFDIYTVLEHLNILYTQKCNEKALSFILEMDKSCPKYLNGDQYRLRQILTNLIENAIKFTNRGTVKLTVTVKDKTSNTVALDFKISDTGIGIEKTHLKTIFNSFYQIKNKQTHSDKGLGLGLSIIKHLLIPLNGEIKVTSELNKGSAFTVHLNYSVSENQSIGENDSVIQDKKEEQTTLA